MARAARQRGSKRARGGKVAPRATFVRDASGSPPPGRAQPSVEGTAGRGARQRRAEGVGGVVGPRGAHCDGVARRVNNLR